MKIELFVYSELALRAETEFGTWLQEGTVETGPGLARMSGGWGTYPGGARIEQWLSGILPENGARDPYATQATNAITERRGHPPALTTGDILWGNADAEYPGAVAIGQSERKKQHHGAGYTRLTDEEIGRRLVEATRIARRQLKREPRPVRERRGSLSGMRGKLSLHLDTEGHWHAATGGELNTWIAKHEDDPRNRGEAGVEAICQRTMGALGIRAARTFSRVLGGEQTVLSERNDRYVDPVTKRVLARHQEDFAQLVGWPVEAKYDERRKFEPRWDRAYEVMREMAPDVDHEHDQLNRILAASWLMGNSDLHRRNLGLSHSLKDEPKKLTIAPLYDVSSAIGGIATNQLAIRIGRQQLFDRIEPSHWMQHAQACDIDPFVILETVRRTARLMPDALASARDQARNEDENKDQSEVNSRIEATIAYAKERAQVFESQIRKMKSRGVRGLDNESEELAEEIGNAVREHGTSDIEIAVNEHGAMVISVVAKDHEDQRTTIGTLDSIRTGVEAMVIAGLRRPDEIPELELALERERENVRARQIE